MLPFGLTTDVSAGALAAGAGGAFGAGAAADAAGAALPGAGGTVFAEELKVATGQGQQDAVRPVSGFKAAVPSGAADEAIEALKALVGEPVAIAQPPVEAPVVVPAEGSGAAASLAVAGADPQLPLQGALDGAIEGEADQSAQETAEAALAGAVPVPVAPELVPAPPAGMAESSGAVPGAVPPEAAASGSGATVNGVPHGMAPGQPGGQAPVPPDVANANAANGLQRAAAAGQGKDGPAIPDEAAGPVVTSPGRRWQNELPQEFRAPAPQAAPVAQNRAAAPLAPVVQAGAGAARAATAPVQPGAAQLESAVPVAAPAAELPVTLPEGTTSAAASQQASVQNGPVPSPAVDVPDAQVTGQAVMQPAGAATTATGKQATPAAGGQQAVTAVPAQLVGTATDVPLTVSSGEALPAELDPETVSLLNKPGAEATVSQAQVKTGGGSAAGNAAANAGPEPGGRTAAPGAGAAPVAAAALAAAVIPDDGEVPLSDLEPGAATEFTSATVRGGDLHGAVRTESLQTPNQTQSAHVATQVAAEIARNLKNGQTHFQMRFDPPELGRVEVNMRVGADGSVQAHLIVDRPETLDMFLRDQRGLERALEAAGLNPDSDNLQFSLKQDGGQEFASGQGDREQPAGPGGSGSEVDAETEPEMTDRVRLMLAAQRGGLDMKV
ncbi:flagellar hook-length control protein FliK [Roseibium sp. Sym1]|uniref:flagellar hook-length control protein FliK n=1 Tax=Roseibium sp. Sym1 TaxID=3016006 RepID=UPI0022B35E2E|nr:flagellar hook-length control protein FliK [Roseibium sp. Sym1]